MITRYPAKIERTRPARFGGHRSFWSRWLRNLNGPKDVQAWAQNSPKMFCVKPAPTFPGSSPSLTATGFAITH